MAKERSQPTAGLQSSGVIDGARHSKGRRAELVIEMQGGWLEIDDPQRSVNDKDQATPHQTLHLDCQEKGVLTTKKCLRAG